MAHVVFYEKPGCINNTRQKTLLRAAGHVVEEHNLLNESWTAERLRPFFDGLPVCDWFNPSAPRIASGEIVPAQHDAETALSLMVRDPLLIRRPLMYVDGRYACGFVPEKIHAWIGLDEIKGNGNLEACPRHHGKSCTTEHTP